MATPNMLLTLPTVGVTAGPAYASQINAALEVVDRHDHSTGSGVQITPAGLNINADLTINSNNLTSVKTVRFTAQPSAIAGTSPNVGCLYVVNDDLYYNDGAGNQIALTIGGSIAGAAGNITGLSAPASVVYTGGGSPNFKFMSTATVSANLDAASLIIRNPGVPATYALTLQAPTLSNNYSITLPALPGAASLLQIDASGVITAAPVVAGGITDSYLASNSVTTAKIADLNVTNAKIADATIQAAKLAFDPALKLTRVDVTSSGTYEIPAGVTNIFIQAVGGGGGGGGGGAANSTGNFGGGGGGGAGGSVILTSRTVTPGEILTITVGSGGSGGAASSPSSSAGSPGADTTIVGTFGTVRARGGLGGSPGAGNTATSSPGPGGTGGVFGGGLSSAGGSGATAQSVTNGNNGDNSVTAAAGSFNSTYGSFGTGGGGGGGGGAGLGAGADGGAAGAAGIAAPTSGSAASANSGGGGGGGGGAANAGNGASGGNGGSGLVSIIYNPVL